MLLACSSRVSGLEQAGNGEQTGNGAVYYLLCKSEPGEEEPKAQQMGERAESRPRHGAPHPTLVFIGSQSPYPTLRPWSAHFRALINLGGLGKQQQPIVHILGMPASSTKVNELCSQSRALTAITRQVTGPPEYQLLALMRPPECS